MFKYEQQFEQTISVTPDILFFAFRYALGRRTFAPQIVSSAIMFNLIHLESNVLCKMISEIMEAWEVNELGDEDDVQTWMDLKRDLEIELVLREG